MCAQQNHSNELAANVAYAYWNDICNTELLPIERQHELIRLIKQGDKTAYDTFVESFLRLVVSRAKKYCHNFDSFMDLVQEGNIGLLAAIERFDPEQGYQFSTYATWWIDKYIRRDSCRTGRPLRIPENQQLAANRLIVADQLFVQETGRAPTVEELADRTDMTPQQVKKLQTILLPPVSLDQDIRMHNPDDSPLVNRLPDDTVQSPEDIVCQKEMKTVLMAFMQATLTPTEFLVLKLRFGLAADSQPHTLDDVAQQTGLTGEGVRKAEQRAIQKLQKEILQSGLTQIDFI